MVWYRVMGALGLSLLSILTFRLLIAAGECQNSRQFLFLRSKVNTKKSEAQNGFGAPSSVYSATTMDDILSPNSADLENDMAGMEIAVASPSDVSVASQALSPRLLDEEYQPPELHVRDDVVRLAPVTFQESHEAVYFLCFK